VHGRLASRNLVQLSTGQSPVASAGPSPLTDAYEFFLATGGASSSSSRSLLGSVSYEDDQNDGPRNDYPRQDHVHLFAKAIAA